MGWFKQRFDGIILVRRLCYQRPGFGLNSVYAHDLVGEVEVLYHQCLCCRIFRYDLLHAMYAHMHQKHTTTAFFCRMISCVT